MLKRSWVRERGVGWDEDFRQNPENLIIIKLNIVNLLLIITNGKGNINIREFENLDILHLHTTLQQNWGPTWLKWRA